MANLWSDDWWGEGIAGVCLDSWQYSRWNRRNQPQFQREWLEQFLIGNDVMRGILEPNARVGDDLETCWQVARAVLDDREPEPDVRIHALPPGGQPRAGLGEEQEAMRRGRAGQHAPPCHDPFRR